MKNLILIFISCFTILIASCATKERAIESKMTPLKIATNGHYFIDGNGEPFFWLGDTGWLLFSKLNRTEAEVYLENRAKKGFNVIQAMVLHNVNVVNCYGKPALQDGDIRKPLTTPGNNNTDTAQYDYWDHVDYIVNLAAKKGIYIAMVPIWGSDVKNGKVNKEGVGLYGKWLGNRYKNCPNIIWMNGGDQNGSEKMDVWNTLGESIRSVDSIHIQTYHPRGRTTSSTWFHDEEWLDFNMCQSGHRTYDQGFKEGEMPYGEDNWKYIEKDFSKIPAKPCLDGEPSYENIPHGLHDTTQPRWNADDLRRYAYWSVFAGAAGFTYGENSVMQMFTKKDKPAYGAKTEWCKAINAEGAGQMHYLKKLMLSRPYMERRPAPTLIAGINGEKYDRIIATRGKKYAMFYTFTGKPFSVNMGKIKGNKISAKWFNPKDGTFTPIGVFENQGVKTFSPPGKTRNGNDSVLILDAI